MKGSQGAAWMPWALGLALALLGGALYFEHTVDAKQRLERKALWMDYLHGPLSDLLFGSSRLRPLVVKKSLSKAEKAEAGEAALSLERSRVVAARICARLKPDPRMEGIDLVLTWHQEIGDLMENWVGLVGKPLGAQSIPVEAQMRLQLWRTLDHLRQQILADGTLSKEDELEMNALLYSLKEDTGAAGGGPER